MPTVSNPSQHSDSPRKIKLAGDYISFLPDEILLLILSHIETKFAIRTSALSKRWKHVWRDTPSISIDSCGVNPSSINKTLSNYSAHKITSFDLSVNYSIKAPQVDSWIKLAMSLNAENLSLTFKSEFKDPGYRFPSCFFVKFRHLRVHYDEISKVFPECMVSWTSLRRLSLNRWNLSGESIAKILSGLSMLESLTLDLCSGLYRIDLSKSVNLKRLEIIGCLFTPGPVEIVAPHIHFLRLENSHQRCTLEDVSSLSEANLNIDYWGNVSSGNKKYDFLQETVVKMLAKLQNIEKLTIGTVFLQILSLAEIRGVVFPQLKIKVLVVETIIVRSIIPGMTSLLQNSPELKKITVYTTKCKVILDKEFDGYLNTKGLNPDRRWNEFFPTVKQTSSIHDGIAKDAKSEHVALFMELLLRSAMRLEMLVLRLGGYLNATEYQKLLPMVPTVSSHKKNVIKHGRDKAVLLSFKITP